MAVTNNSSTGLRLSSRRSNNSSPSSASANTDTSSTRSRQRPRYAIMSTRVYGYQSATPARNSTVFLPFSYGQGDRISVPVPHYFEASIDPPIIEIEDNEPNEDSTSPPSYAELFTDPPTHTSPPTQPSPTTQPDTQHQPVASSSRVPAEVTVTTLIQSSSGSTRTYKNGKGRSIDSLPMAIFSSSLNSGYNKKRIRQNINSEEQNNSKNARYGTVNKTSDVYRTHLAAASSCTFYTPYDHSKKIKAIEQLTGARVESTNPFDLVVLKGINRQPISYVKDGFIKLWIYIDMVANIKLVKDTTEILVIKTFKIAFIHKLKNFPAIKVVFS
ncbi:hypothetical protein AYI70_g6767 [Smittium culicis]|uniref:Uncharacterized protein n=1 Tax=Smittium culicis TaxID=133412 RepID=A0A1R1XNJ9_9FUNG|nr:hypothetical protein AYI70_g6767 [Smittium culicis]